MNMFKDFIARYKDPKNPVTKIMMISTGLIFISAIIMGLFLSYYISYYMKKNNADDISHFVKSYVKEHFNESNFIGRDSGGAALSNGNFKDMLLEMKNVLRLQSINIFDPTGKIIWPDNEKITKISSKRLKKTLGNKLAYGFAKLGETGAGSANNAKNISGYQFR